MKLLISFLTIISLSFLSNGNQGLPKEYKKKIEKTAKKALDNKGITFQEKDIENSLKLTSDFQIFELYQENNIIGYATLNRTNACRVGGCSMSDSSSKNEAYEKFYYLCIFNNNCKLQKVKVLEYESEYGYEITSRGWLKQFTKNVEKEFNYGENIDALSGATVSAESMVKDINKQLNFMCKLKSELQSATR